MVQSIGAILAAQRKMSMFHSAALHIDPSLPERCDELEWRAQFRQFCLALEKLKNLEIVIQDGGDGELTSIQVLKMLLAAEHELFKGCEAVIDILIQAALIISVESVVESWISVLEHHSSKTRNLGNDAIDAEMLIAVNGPSIVHCPGIVKETMKAFWSQGNNVNLHTGHFVRSGTGALKLFKVSKAVDTLNNEPAKCKFML